MQDIHDFEEWRPGAKRKLENAGFQVVYGTNTGNQAVVKENASSIEFENGSFAGTIIVYDWHHIEVQLFLLSDYSSTSFHNLILDNESTKKKLDTFLEHILKTTQASRS